MALWGGSDGVLMSRIGSENRALLSVTELDQKRDEGRGLCLGACSAIMNAGCVLLVCLQEEEFVADKPYVGKEADL